MIKRLAMGVAIFIACTIAASPAFAKHHHKKYYEYSEGQIVSHPPGCPWSKFCGCGSCVEVGISVADCKRRGLFRAAKWLELPRANPGPGMAAARYGHVMIIKSYDGNGNAVVYDPNSGNHQTRVHARSLSGYRIVNPYGSRMASQ